MALEPNDIISLTAFPNPTSEILFLQINEEDFPGIFYQLFDLTGKLMLTSNVTQKLSEISFVNQPCGIYFLKVFLANKNIQTIKIIKE
jgi:hypothetical protein